MATQSRWQFSRAGITNVYQYENEVFSFREGRLLLRGINGSGKSTAMNMLLPFLLTGKTRGIDAAGEQTGVLKSWMLSGRDEKQPVGYLWLEFSRQTEDESQIEYLSIGCGIKANRASDTVNTWWFVTSRRAGIDFELLEQQVPLSADALRTVIQPDQVYTQDRRADYRLEVGRRLYGGAQIESFLDLINTLRSPRVGDRVDVELPQYLVAALPNLSETALSEAARPLDDLDEHRRNVGELGTTAEALAAITEVYRNYAIAECHRELLKAKEALADLRRKSRVVKKSQEAWADAQHTEAQARETQAVLEEKIEQAELQVHALERSPAYTEGQQLEDLRRHVLSLSSSVQKDSENLQTHKARQPEVVAQVASGEQRTDERWKQLSDELTQINRCIEQVSLQQRAPGVVTVSRLPLSELSPQGSSPSEPPTEPLEPFDAESLNAQLLVLNAASNTRKVDLDTAREQLRQVKTATSVHENARAAQSQAIESVEENTLRFDTAREGLQKAREAWTHSGAEWVKAAKSAIVNAVRHIGFERIEATYLNADGATSTADLPAFRHTLEKGINQTHDAQQRITIALEAQLKEALNVREKAQLEVDRLNAMTEPAVPKLDWQQPAALCFADLVDFRDDVPVDQQAGLEAAMQASGLLSATIKSDALVLENGELVISTSSQTEHPLSTLLEVTLPANCDIDKQMVQNTLDAISTQWSATATSVVTVEGQFRLGALSGRHTKLVAEYIGVSARRARLEQMRREALLLLDEANSVVAQVESENATAHDFAKTLDGFRATLPALDQVDSALARASALEDELLRARDRLVAKEREVNTAEKALSAAEQECHRICRSLQLPVDATGLDSIERVLIELASLLVTAQRTSVSVAQACRDWTAAAERWRIAQQDLKLATERHAASQSEYDGERARLSTLEATLGTSYAQVVAQIGDYQRQVKTAKESLPAAKQKAEQAVRHTQIALNDKDNNMAAQGRAEQQCVQHHQHLQAVTQVPGLLMAVAMNDDSENNSKPPSLPSGSADANGLEVLSNALQALLPTTDSTETTADGVRMSLRHRRNSLGAGWDAEDYQPSIDLPLSITVNGPLVTQIPLPESLQTVRTQLSRLQALLTEKQDQALRNLLQGLIAREVAEKMFQAKRLIDRMNERLGSVTSTHGIGVRLRWRQSQELDDNVAATVKILGKQPDLRTESEEATLREALATALEEARRLEPDAPYRQLIAQVFDYRAWHDMAILLRRGDDPEKRLNRRTPLSEGEKKLVSYLPLFAAVAASCDALTDAGGDSVPRFLLLDDAFAKVSEDNHAALFGLLVDLDLDFIATSERLWGTHASVPGLAITEVVRDTALGAILLEHSLWDGHTLHMAAGVNLEEEVFGDALITEELVSNENVEPPGDSYHAS